MAVTYPAISPLAIQWGPPWANNFGTMCHIESPSKCQRRVHTKLSGKPPQILVKFLPFSKNFTLNDMKMHKLVWIINIKHLLATLIFPPIPNCRILHDRQYNLKFRIIYPAIDDMKSFLQKKSETYMKIL